MRQKLIHILNTNPPLSKNGIQESFVRLQTLLFGATMSKVAWDNNLKSHIKTISNLLLNNQHVAFEQYLCTHFDSQLTTSQKNPSCPSFLESGLMSLDYRPFLQEFLQLAVLIEHSTIPAYLTAMYSIQDGKNLLASQIIRSVVLEEMLHMIMVCNVMNAIDIQPSVNKPENYPTYPIKLPLNVDFYVSLEKFSNNSISTFISIESPSNPKVKIPTFEGTIKAAMSLPENIEERLDCWSPEGLKRFLEQHVSTIGEFYDTMFFFIVIFQVIEFYKATGRFPQSLEQLNKGGIFQGKPAKQINPEQYYGSGGKLYAVEDLLSVVEVFQEIKGQGEGADDTIFVDASQFEEGAELAHYFRFKEILHEHFYVGGNYTPFKDDKGMMPVTTPPVGKELPIDWNAVYPIKTNAKLADYQSQPSLYAQAKTFNETYKKMLDTIQVAVEGHPEALQKSVLYMYTLKEQAVGLMRQPLNGQENASPTFEYPME